jgi:putative hydrolase of the HAD superfamily
MIKFIFLVGRTLIDEQNFFSFIDSRLLYLLNQFGAKIDNKNYFAIKNDIIKNRKLSKNRAEELVIQICRVLMPKGYEKMILRYILPSVEFAEKNMLYAYDDSMDTLKILANNFKIGIMGSNERELSKILKIHGMDRYINCCVLSCNESNQPNREIFHLILNMLGINPSEALLVGDRLDTHVYLANSLGMVSVRISNSRFKLQEATNQNEVPKLRISKLQDLMKTDYIKANLND